MSVTILQKTGRQLIYEAYRDLGCLRPNQGMSNDVNADGLAALNEFMDSLLIDELMVFTTRDDIYPLVGSQQTYTIGRGAGADFIADRPTQITQANVILNMVNPIVRYPLAVITVQQVANIRVPTIPQAIPQVLYYDGGLVQESTFGSAQNASIFLWPGPLVNYDLELFTWQQLTSFADLDTQYNFPPGYARMIRKNLAVEMAPMFRIHQKIDENLFPEIQRQARESRQALQDFNAPDPLITTEPAFRGSSQQGAWNYVIGDYNRWL